MPMFKVYVTETTWHRPARVEADNADEAKLKARDEWAVGNLDPVDCDLRCEVSDIDGNPVEEDD